MLPVSKLGNIQVSGRMAKWQSAVMMSTQTRFSPLTCILLPSFALGGVYTAQAEAGKLRVAMRLDDHARWRRGGAQTLRWMREEEEGVRAYMTALCTGSRF